MSFWDSQGAISLFISLVHSDAVTFQLNTNLSQNRRGT